jgi:hypothetical protein
MGERTANMEPASGSEAEQNHSSNLKNKSQLHAMDDARIAADKVREAADSARYTIQKAGKHLQESVPECRPTPFTEQDGRNLHDELAADGLIRKQDQVSYLLNSSELIINHVKQPEEIHQKYAARYVKYTGRSILYNYEYISSH